MCFVRSFSIALLLAVSSPGPFAKAATPPPAATAAKETKIKTPHEIVDQTVAKVLKILGDPEYKKASEKPKMREKVRVVILQQVDMKTVSALTLANYRKKFSEDQLTKFSASFSRLLFSAYITHLEKYTDEKVVIVESKKLSDTRELVRTKTVTATKEIPVDYSFLKQGKKWMLYDVRVEGVSLIKNYRTQFRELLLKCSAEEFLVRLEKKVKQNEANL